MKTCGFENRINQYLDGELSGAKLRSFEAHLQECPSCREEVEQYRGLLDELHGLEEREVPPALQERLRAALSNEIAKGDGRVKRKLNPWALTAAAAALVVVLVGGTMLAGGGLLGPLGGKANNYDLAGDDGNLNKGYSVAPEEGMYDAAADRGFGSEQQAAATAAPAAEAPAAPAPEAEGWKGGEKRNALSSTADGKAMSGEDNLTKAVEGRKIIYTAYLVLETRTYDKSVGSLEALLEKYGGYRENSQETGVPDANESTMGRTAVITIRMPLDKYGSAIDELQTMGNVLSKNENTEDVSRQYVDTDARNKTLKTQRNRYMALLEKADSTESIIALQNEITRLTVEIEQMTAQLNYWDDKVSYSTITVEIRELVTPKSVKPVDPDLNTRMGGALNATINNMKKGAEDFAVRLVGFLPWLAIILVVAGILAAILIPVARKARRAAMLKEAAPKQKEE